MQTRGHLAYLGPTLWHAVATLACPGQTPWQQAWHRFRGAVGSRKAACLLHIKRAPKQDACLVHTCKALHLRVCLQPVAENLRLLPGSLQLVPMVPSCSARLGQLLQASTKCSEAW